jgi:signal peptidase I
VASSIRKGMMEWMRAWREFVVGKNPRKTLVRAALLAAFCTVVFRFFFMPAMTRGSSMEPTYGESGFNIVNKLAFKWGGPRRGDVVAIRIGKGTSYMYLKRIVALPGETIDISGGQVRINGVLLDEPYVKFREPWKLREVRLEPDEYYVIGDNRGQDMESHRMGRVKLENIEGKVLF